MWQACCKCSICPEDAWGRHSPSGRMGKQSPLGFRGSPWEGLGGPGLGKDDSQGLGWENRLAILWESWWVTFLLQTLRLLLPICFAPRLFLPQGFLSQHLLTL